MALTREQLEREALALPDEERITLGEALLLSVPKAGIEIDEEWDAEIARRVDEIRSGKIEGIPYATVRRNLHQKLGW